jgi:hypothetical protein
VDGLGQLSWRRFRARRAKVSRREALQGARQFWMLRIRSRVLLCFVH